jgi:hypothetical protein
VFNFFKRRHKKSRHEVSQDNFNRLRKMAKGRRICITNEGIISIYTLAEIRKYGYRLIGDVKNYELETVDERKILDQFRKINAIIESGEDKIEK